MNSTSVLTCPFSKRNLTALLFCIGVATLILTATARGQLEGFSEPFRQIELSSDEAGAISFLAVEEGQNIKENDIVCKLDSGVQEIQVEIAKEMAESDAELLAAEENYKKREEITNRINQLVSSGNATKSEKLRTEMELRIAKARYLTAKQDAKVREIEYRRALLQLERRTVRAPFSGVVSKVHKREGEFISPLHPEIVSLIQVDRLIAKFNVPSSQIDVFQVGKKFQLDTVDGRKIEASVFSVSVFTQAESGTVEVKLVIENHDESLRSGEFLTLQI